MNYRYFWGYLCASKKYRYDPNNSSYSNSNFIVKNTNKKNKNTTPSTLNKSNASHWFCAILGKQNLPDQDWQHTDKLLLLSGPRHRSLHHTELAKKKKKKYQFSRYKHTLYYSFSIGLSICCFICWIFNCV